MGLTVSIDADKQEIIGEQTVDEAEFGLVFEMISDPAKLDQFVPGASAKAKQLAEAAKDEHPEFPVVRVEEGWSRSKRLWDADALVSIAEQVNALEPVAHLGHIKDEDAATAFPEPQTTWLAATTKDEPSKMKERKGKVVKTIYLAGYNLPDAKIRTLIKTRAVRGVSWWGRGREVPIPGQGVQVKDFAVRAVDWARKLSEGMPTARVVAVTAEMEGGTVSDKALSQVTPEEFKKENPNGFALLVSEATAEKDKQIGEMEKEIEEGKKSKSLLDKVMAVLGIEDAGALEAEVVKLKEKVGEKASLMVKDALAKLLEEKVPDEGKRALVQRLLPVSEMEAKAADAKDGEAVTKLVGEMVDDAFNKDDLIKTQIGEMAPASVRRREEIRTGGSDSALQSLGIKRERVKMG